MPKISGLTSATAVNANDLVTIVQNGETKNATAQLLQTAPEGVTGPATNTANNIPQWDGADSKTLKDGLSLVTTVGATGIDTAIVSEQGVREAIANLTTSPATNTDNNIPQWDGANSKLLKDGLSLVTTLGSVGLDTAVVSEQGVREAIADLTTSPASNTADYIPQWDGADSKTLKDGLSLVTTVGATGLDTAIVSEQGVREAIDTLDAAAAPKLFNHVIQASTATLSAADVSGTVISNYGQIAENTQTLPTAALGYNGLIQIATGGAGSFHLKAGASDNIYLDGTALNDGDKVTLASPTVGDFFSFWSFQTGATAFDWVVASGQGTLTDGGA